MSRTPATCSAEQANRTDMLVLRTIHMVSATGRGANMIEVRDLLVLCYSLTAQEADQAISDAEAHGLIRLRSAPTV